VGTICDTAEGVVKDLQETDQVLGDDISGEDEILNVAPPGSQDTTQQGVMHARKRTLSNDLNIWGKGLMMCVSGVGDVIAL
jgi:hypothetical protein